MFADSQASRIHINQKSPLSVSANISSSPDNFSKRIDRENRQRETVLRIELTEYYLINEAGVQLGKHESVFDKKAKTNPRGF